MNSASSDHGASSDVDAILQGARIQRKMSVSDLLARLTTPTAASRGKMRDASRAVSSPHDLRSINSFGARGSSHGSHVSISRPIPVKPPVISASKSPPSINNSPLIGRKAPSPPLSVPKQRSVQKVSNSGSPSLGGPRPAPKPDASGTKHAAGETKSDSKPGSKPRSNTRSDTKPSVKPSSRLVSSPSTRSISAPSTDMSASFADGRSETTRIRGHRRRLSAPAPPLNLTNPRAMSKATMHLNSGAVSTSVTPTSISSSRFHSANGWGDSSVASSADSSPTTPKGYDSFGGSPQHGPQQGGTPVPPPSTILSLKQELAKTKEYNESLKTRNRLLKSRLDNVLKTYDETTIELSTTQAARNALQQQVNGYDTLYENTLKSLHRSQKLVKILKFNLQELKMTVEEKDLEIYNLTRQINREHGEYGADSEPTSPTSPLAAV